MKGRIRAGVMIAAILVWGAAIDHARAEESETVSTLGASTSLSGLTGLLVTESTHTLPPWKAAVSVAGGYMHSSSPTVNLYQAAGIVGLGLPGRVELAAVVPGEILKTSGSPSGTGMGDMQASGKWRVLHQRESLWPSLAVAATVTLPTGQRSKGLRTVERYGVAAKAIVSADVDFSPDQYAVGLYAEAGYFFQDLDEATQDKRMIYAVGAALPLVMRAESPLLSPLQFLMEVNGTYKRGTNQDYVTLTPSVRYVGLVTVTAGFQYSSISHAPDALGGVVQVGFVF
jgi:hypothetical protein